MCLAQQRHRRLPPITIATLAQRRRRVIAIGAVLTAATFLVIVTALNTLRGIGLGPHALYEDHVTIVAWAVSMVLCGFMIRRRLWNKGPLDAIVAVVLGSDIGSVIWLTIWTWRCEPSWKVPLRAIAIVGLPVALAAVPLAAFGIVLADLRPQSRRRFG
jgi:hypothetical protein